MNEGESARSRLLETAARLFAEQGIDAVSLREIVREAGVKHATAVQYHFGDRAGLLAAVLEDHFRAVERRRTRMLDDLDDPHARADARMLAAALIHPLAAELTTRSGRFFLQIYAQMLTPGRPRFSDDGSSVWRWRELTTPFVAAEAQTFHPRFAGLSYAAGALASRAAKEPDDDRLFVSRLVDVVAAVMTAPVSVETAALLEERRGVRTA